MVLLNNRRGDEDVKKSKWFLVIVMLLTAVLVLSACGSSSQPAPEEPSANEKPVEQPAPASSGPPSPPHSIDGDYANCLSCHDTESPINKPSPHPQRGNCSACHQPAN